ncbi:MAG: helix-hairpin-helix domain-containing protein [Bacteroidia bacterium]|nr:helix-hairpin-helix domain-containing protein [Bacteroidia bacterium]
MYAKLAELHEKNPFRYKAFANASFNLKKIKDSFLEMSDADLLSVPGVGKGVVEAIRDIQRSGSFADLQELVEITPDGIVEILKIKGLGPKKVSVIWRELGIESSADLLNACRENRLLSVKGFGLKTQADVIHSIEFALSSKGRWHYARLLEPATEFKDHLKKFFNGSRIEFTGAFRRAMPEIDKIEVLVDLEPDEVIEYCDEMQYNAEWVDEQLTTWLLGQYPVVFHFADRRDFERVWFETTGSQEHLELLGYNSTEFESEEKVYQSRGYCVIVPEQREGLNELREDFPREELIEFWQLKGVLHNHTTYSDGLNSLREMAEFARDQKYDYLGICDHSKSAGYAGGLSEERLLQQIKEIDQLNAELAPFKIFKGIESDILSDGSLDYSNEVLGLLDFVVASVHSGLKMDEEKANQRLIKAIENPYTTILGHPTGRLLLLREGYPIDHKKIIDACAANDVVIELNAHPWRLDIDWKWIDYAQSKGVMISINPDAHEKSGYHDMYFGALAARKGGLLTRNTLNAMDLSEFEFFIQENRKKKVG